MNSQLTRRESLFALAQSVFLPTAAYAAYRTRRNATFQQVSLPRLREQPIRVEPLFDQREIVTDEQLFGVLRRVRLQRAESPAKLNYVDHALRLWGHKVHFDDTLDGQPILSGPDMLAVLIDDQAYRTHFGKATRPLFDETSDGLLVRVQEGSTSSSHVDHTLATLAEIGLPLSRAMQTRYRKRSIRDLLNSALRSFSLNQQEFEWTCLVLGLYSADGHGFVTTEGQRLSFDLLADRIMREPFGHGVCYGGHRLFTLTMLKRLDAMGQTSEDSAELFSDETRERIRTHLMDATQRLVQHQDPAGFWDDAWPGHAIPNRKQIWRQGAQLVATGHALEWWAMLDDPNLLPPRDTLVRAGQWLVQEVEQMESATIQKNFTFLTHAARALSLWRGQFPAAAWKRLQTSLWNDESGAILSMELILLATIVVVGALVGLATYRDAMVQELGDSAASIASLNQTFSYDEVSQSGSFGDGVSLIEYRARTEGSRYEDARDFCEAVLDATLDPPMCISLVEAAEDEI